MRLTSSAGRSRLGLSVVGLVLVAGMAAGCGGDDDGGEGGTAADEPTSVEEFCAAFQDFYDSLSGLSGDEADLGKTLKAAAAKIEDVGTPEDMPADAAAGLEVVLGQISDLPDDASADEIAGQEGELSKEDRAKSDAFVAYLAETCPGLSGDTTSRSEPGS